MRLTNERGESIYYNIVIKHGKERWQVVAISGQTITGRDREKRKTRSFAQEHQAEAWLRRMGYEVR